MSNSKSDEYVYRVSGSQATPLESVDIATLNLLERQHLQEWVLQQPQLLGDGILIITFEFDQWAIGNGSAPRDRLDVLGLDEEGRLVVAELKRGRHSDSVDLQSLKYAALASRFTETQVATLHMEFVNRNPDTKKMISLEDAQERISSHVTTGLSSETLANTRIVILAEGFTSTVTSTVVWLNEQGVDISLKTFKAYMSDPDIIILTVSQIFPVAGAEDLMAGPLLKHEQKSGKKDLPFTPWGEEDLFLLQTLGFQVPIAILDLASSNPGTWIPSSAAYEKANVDRPGGMGRLAGFGYSVRTRFKRSNAPWTTDWAKGGTQEAYYSVDPETAAAWQRLKTTGAEDAGNE